MKYLCITEGGEVFQKDFEKGIVPPDYLKMVDAGFLQIVRFMGEFEEVDEYGCWKPIESLK